MQKEKAKRFLESALLALMKEKPYEKISISEICASAFLSRASFYKHFSSKDELLRYQFKVLLLADFTAAEGQDSIIKLTAALAARQEYTQVISEQRLIEKLLPELAVMLCPESVPYRDSIYCACYTYLSCLFGVRELVSPSELIAWYLHDTRLREPDIKFPPQSKLSTNQLRLADKLLWQLENGSSLSELSVKGLTAAAGVNRSSFYRCFTDIQDLFLRCVRRLILDDAVKQYDEKSISVHYEKYRTLLKNAWAELGIERFMQLYVTVLNEFDGLVHENRLPQERLRNICFAAKRTAMLYSFL